MEDKNSTSFIVLFNSKSEMNECFSKMMKAYPDYAVKVFKEIKRNPKTFPEIAKFVEAKIKWEAHNEIIYNTPENKTKEYRWRHSAEFETKQKEYIKKEMDKFNKEVNHKGIFAIITYPNQNNEELIQDVLPNMPFIIKVISNYKK